MNPKLPRAGGQGPVPWPGPGARARGPARPPGPGGGPRGPCRGPGCRGWARDPGRGWGSWKLRNVIKLLIANSVVFAAVRRSPRRQPSASFDPIRFFWEPGAWGLGPGTWEPGAWDLGLGDLGTGDLVPGTGGLPGQVWARGLGLSLGPGQARGPGPGPWPQARGQLAIPYSTWGPPEGQIAMPYNTLAPDIKNPMGAKPSESLI